MPAKPRLAIKPAVTVARNTARNVVWLESILLPHFNLTAVVVGEFNKSSRYRFIRLEPLRLLPIVEAKSQSPPSARFDWAAAIRVTTVIRTNGCGLR
jgi:hypothetical protein